MDMLVFLNSLPPGTFVSIDALRSWLAGGRGPAEGGLLQVSAADFLSIEQHQIWRNALPQVGVQLLERPLPCP